jgi:hypothetical protein
MRGEFNSRQLQVTLRWSDAGTLAGVTQQIRFHNRKRLVRLSTKWLTKQSYIFLVLYVHVFPYWLTNFLPLKIIFPGPLLVLLLYFNFFVGTGV